MIMFNNHGVVYPVFYKPFYNTIVFDKICVTLLELAKSNVHRYTTCSDVTI